MPRARFFKLEHEKQEMIIDVALEEFATNGFENASLNRIIKTAGISKGAMYYYFDDKQDLYGYCFKRLFSALESIFPTTIPAETPDQFWDALEVLSAEQMANFTENHEMTSLMKDFMVQYNRFPEQFKELNDLMMRLIEGILTQGQRIGAIRQSMPNSLLVASFLALGYTMDSWLLNNIDSLKELNTNKIIKAYLEIFKGLLRPGHVINDEALYVLQEFEK